MCQRGNAADSDASTTDAVAKGGRSAVSASNDFRPTVFQRSSGIALQGIEQDTEHLRTSVAPTVLVF